MKNYKLNRKFQFLFPFLFVIGIVLIILGFNDRKNIDLKYNENNSVHYNVYLKDNKFFDSKYLEEGRTYIASLIDYIDIFFHYDLTYNQKISGSYKYKLVAIVTANKKEGSGYYWQKRYDLTEEKIVKLKNKNIVSIDDSVKVKYNTYNDILNKFKKEYGISTDGELKVVMEIENVANMKKVDVPIKIDSQINLSIPLMEQALEVSINKDTTTNDNIIGITKKSDRPAYFIFKVTGTIIVITSLLGFIDVTKTNILFKKGNLYELTLDNILSSYDGIIVNVNQLPDLVGFQRIEVNSFEELLDVYNEVRMPINYFKKENKSTFIIISDSIVWMFTLKNHSMKRVDNNENEGK